MKITKKWLLENKFKLNFGGQSFSRINGDKYLSCWIYDGFKTVQNWSFTDANERNCDLEPGPKTTEDVLSLCRIVGV